MIAPLDVTTSTVTVEPQSGERFLTVASGSARRVVSGISGETGSTRDVAMVEISYANMATEVTDELTDVRLLGPRWSLGHGPLLPAVMTLEMTELLPARSSRTVTAIFWSPARTRIGMV